jgi:hypothetical protein
MPPRWQLDNEADLEGEVMDVTPTVPAGTVTVGPHARASERGSVSERRTSVLAALRPSRRPVSIRAISGGIVRFVMIGR